MIKLSVVIITFNEERNIERCLASVKDLADEIVVVDSGSTDNTQNICETYNTKFYSHPFEGHIEQKNYALTLAKNDFVLSLDADEALSAELKDSILEVKKSGNFDGYTMNRLTNYCGSWIKHSDWYPDIKLRLFKKEKGRWGGLNPHDKFILQDNSKTKHLEGDLLHYSYYTVEEHQNRTIKYAEIAAQSLFNLHKKTSIFRPYLSALVKFLRIYILKLGFLDGFNGLIISTMTAWGTYLKYKKLYNLNKREKV